MLFLFQEVLILPKASIKLMITSPKLPETYNFLSFNNFQYLYRQPGRPSLFAIHPPPIPIRTKSALQQTALSMNSSRGKLEKMSIPPYSRRIQVYQTKLPVTFVIQFKNAIQNYQTELPLHPNISSNQPIPTHQLAHIINIQSITCCLILYFDIRKMSTLQKKIQIRQCLFELQTTNGTANIKFPCTFFLQWKTANGKHHIASTLRHRAQQGTIPFQQTLQLQALLVYDTKLQTYRNKQSIVLVNLLSNARPNDPKLVGRVELDLANFANSIKIQELKQYPLKYCSVEASLTLRVVLKQQKTTNLDAADLERSDFTQSDSPGPQLPHRREDIKSEILSSGSSVLSINKEKISPKASQVAMQDRLNRLRAEKEVLNVAKGEGAAIRLKKQLKIQFADDREGYTVSGEAGGTFRPSDKKLQGDFSVPVLAKNNSQFDSNKISQRTIKNQKSEKGLPKYVESPKFGDALKQMEGKRISQRPLEESVILDNETHQNGVVQKDIAKRGEEEVQKIQSKKQSKKSIIQQKIEQKSNQKLPENKELSAKIIQVEQQLKQKQLSLQKNKQDLSAKELQISKLKQISEKQSKQIIQYQLQSKQRQVTIADLSSLLNSQENLMGKIQELTKQLEQMSLENQHLNSIIQKKQSNQATAISDPRTQALEKQIEVYDHKCSTSQKKYENIKIQLQQQREWYNDLQKQTQQLQIDKQNLQSQLQQYKSSPSQSSNNNSALHQQQLNKLQTELTIKLQQINQLKEKFKNLQSSLQAATVQISQKNQQLQYIRQQLVVQQEQVARAKQVQNQIRVDLQQTQKHLQQKSLQFQIIGEELKLQQSKYIELQKVIQDGAKNNKNLVKSKQQAIEQNRSRLNDLAGRLREKQDIIARHQREKQHLQVKLKQSLFSSQQYKQKLKTSQSDKFTESQKSKQLQRDIRLMQKQIVQIKSKLQSEGESYNKTINKLKTSLQQETNQRRQLQNKHSQNESVSNVITNRTIKQLQQKIQGYIKKQQVLKENVTLIQSQISKISETLQQKQQKQDQYNDTILALHQAHSQLTIKISQLQNQLAYYKERSDALEQEVQLLNAYMPEEQDSSHLLDINKRLTDKNKQLLELIQHKNTAIAMLQRKEGQSKNNEAKQQLHNSRKLKQKSQLQDKVASLSQQNQKLYKQFEKLNSKYEQQLSIVQKMNQQKSSDFIKTIDLLNKHIKQLQHKELSYLKHDNKINEQPNRLQETIHQKQFQIQINNNQIKQLNQTIQGLRAQLNVLNNQYQNIYSELGQKQFQLYEASSRIKDLQDSLPSPRQGGKAQRDVGQTPSEVQQLRAKLQCYQVQSNRLREKQMARERDIQQLQEQLDQIQTHVEKQQERILSLNTQLASQKQKKTECENKIVKLQQAITQMEKNITTKLNDSESALVRKTIEYQSLQSDYEEILSKHAQLQKDNHTLKEQINYLTKNIDTIKQQVSRQSGRSTPIHQFIQSPSPAFDINLPQIIQEIAFILTKRKQQQQLQSALRLVIDNNARQQQQFQRWTHERGAIQQKAKLASKQLQKAKSAIMKNTSRSITQKTQITTLLRPTESIIVELIHLSQTLSEIDMEMQNQQTDQIQPQQVTS